MYLPWHGTDWSGRHVGMPVFHRHKHRLIQRSSSWKSKMAIFHTDIFVNSMDITLQLELCFLGIFKIVFTHKELGIPKEQLATKSLPFLLPLSADHALSKSQVLYQTECTKTMPLWNLCTILLSYTLASWCWVLYFLQRNYIEYHKCWIYLCDSEVFRWIICYDASLFAMYGGLCFYVC